LIIGLDLAAKFSAAVVLDDGGEVIDQFDSWGISALAFLDKIVNWMTYSQTRVKLVIEDVPYGIGNQKMIKSVLRLQGFLQGLLVTEIPRDRLEDVYYVLPSTWQRCFEGVWRGGKEGAEAAAKTFHYEAPDLLVEYADRLPAKGPMRTKALADLRKIKTDYNDAFLIAEWAFAADDELGEVTQPFFI
jgi:hypothetical protein